MALRSYDVITREHGAPLDKETSALDILIRSIGVGPSAIEIAEAAYKILRVYGKLRADAGVGPDDVIVKTQLDAGVSGLQGQLDTVTTHLGSIDASLASLDARIGTSQSGVDSLYAIVDRLYSGLPLEETFTATEGQTAFTTSSITFTYDNSNFDILVFVNGRKMEQAASGADYHKVSSSQISFEYGLRADSVVTIRQNIPWSVVTSFLNYFTGVSGLTVPTGGLYNQGTNQLAVYRNGLYLTNTLAGASADRYSESHKYAILLAEAAVPSAVFVVLNRFFTPLARTATSGLTGFNLLTPSYTLSNNSLMVYRNGMLLNSAALGDAVLQYTETDTTHVNVSVASSVDTLWIFEVLPSAPAWRQDQTGVTGLTVSFSGSYVVGSKRLLIFKNGLLMINTSDTSIGTANDRYVEATGSSITLETASVSTDVWSAINF